MESGQDLLTVGGIGKYFNLTQGIFSRMLNGERILKAVDRISFRISKGRTLGLVGESGCGKSTVARLITRLIKPTFGNVIFKGVDLLGLTEKEMLSMRKHIQMIFQDPYSSLNPRKVIEKIVGLPLEIHFQMRGKDRRQRVIEVLQLVGMGADHMDRYPHEFSGGQRQRLAIARSLALNPDLIVCDEPVSALDVSIQAQILNLFRKLQDELGLTYLFISHDLGVVEHISNEVAVMYAGRIVEYSSTAEIFSSALHPYTQSLISARFGDRNERQRYSMKGEIVSPINPPKGCRLQRRCPFRSEQCIDNEPELREISEGHFVACFNPLV